MERSSSRLSSRAMGRPGSNRTVAPPSQIKVVARFRPITEGTKSCIEEMTDQSVLIAGLSQQFNFDRVFGPETTQESVFAEAVRPTIEGVLAGYNGCVLAYGQTGAGKSHTMMGGNPESDRGAIPRMVDYLFSKKPESHKVKVGFLEIYNEKVRDLLGTTYPGEDLRVHEVNGGGGFYVKNLTEIAVEEASEVYALMKRGDRNRSTAATNMNAHSSRSHSVFLVDVYGPQTHSKLVLVDLAGSEKVAKTGARGLLLEEAVNINKSLSSLGMVVNALAAQADMAESGGTQIQRQSSPTPSQQSQPQPTQLPNQTPQSSSQQPSQFQHIPFRDSKLTRILQDSLAGNSRTCLIVHCSPSYVHLSETVSTLRFGIRAKHVKTVPRINFSPSSCSNNGASNATLQSTIGRLQFENFQMQQQLVQSHEELYEALMAERSRLLSQKAKDREDFMKKKRELASLEVSLKEEEERVQKEETHLFQNIGRLDARINKKE